MNIWKFQSGYSNDFTSLIYVNPDDMDALTPDGQAKNWPVPIQLQPGLEKSKKKQKPLGDINGVLAGSVVLNPKAYAVLKDFLSPFGQLLPVECRNEGGLLGADVGASETHYFYNVTNIIDCIDEERSEKRGATIVKPAFAPQSVPQEPQIFKDPRRVRVDIYLNEAAKVGLEKLLAQDKLSGAQIVFV